MENDLSGGCLCGKIRYRIPGGAKPATYCHCSDCRKTTGSAFNIGVRVEANSLTVVSGQVKAYARIADSGNTITREFCSDCGSPLFTKMDVYPQFVWIKAGTLEQPELVNPTHQIWMDSSVSWSRIADNLPSFPKSAPAKIKDSK